MSDLPVKNIGSIAGLDRSGAHSSVQKQPSGSFDAVINEAIDKATQIQTNVDSAVRELATGGDITDAVLAMEKADMSFQLMVEIRNKLLTTYEEVMKMQV